MIVIFVPAAIIGWYAETHPDSVLVETGYELILNVPLAVWIAMPVTIVVGMYA